MVTLKKIHFNGCFWNEPYNETSSSNTVVRIQTLSAMCNRMLCGTNYKHLMEKIHLSAHCDPSPFRAHASADKKNNLRYCLECGQTGSNDP